MDSKSVVLEVLVPCRTPAARMSVAEQLRDGYCSRTPTSTPTPTSISSQTQTQTITFVHDPNRKIVQKEGPNAGDKIPAPPRAVLENMCEGIFKVTGSRANEILLTKASEAQRALNRENMCPDGWCAEGVADYIKTFYPSGVPSWAQAAITAADAMTCDEFPFARSVEGGKLDAGVRICVPATENSWQGGTMASYFKEFTDKAKTRLNPKFIRENEKFVVKISGWDCVTQKPDPSLKRYLELSRRDSFSGNVNMTGGEESILVFPRWY